MSWPGPSFTPVNIPLIPERIRYADSIFMMGSCFAEHIANKLEQYKYDVFQNPFGILYNPVSLAESVHRIVDRKYYTGDELIFHDGLYHSMDHHGSFSGVKAEDVLLSINTVMDEAYHHLTRSKFIFISPGTTWVYRYLATGHLVGNCHKIPQARFEKSKLTFEETQAANSIIYDLLKKVSPAASILWTVSPVRHSKDGMVENQRSKATLIVAIEQMVTGHADCFYFPAYEIMIDQLRDYRYYADDLVHPSASAIDIIWNVFAENYLDPNEIKIHAQVEKINQGMHHRFLHARPETIADFASSQLELIQRTKKLILNADFVKETQYFTSLLKA
jgi:hypothetical protein